jgi:ferrochelatase
MRYSRPSSADALEAIAAAGIRRIVTLTLFPHYSKATTGSSRNEFDRALALPRWQAHGFEVTHIEHYPEDPLYLDAMTDTVRRAWERIPAEGRHRAVILFSAHGLPQKFIDEGDPYVAHIQATRYGILQRLDLPNRQLLAYQSRTGPVKWLGPGTEELIEELGREGVSDLLIVPLSFVSDHIETLYEVDQLFAETAREAGITGYYRPEALNTHPLYIDSLTGLVRRHVGAGFSEPAEAALAAGATA